MNYFSRPAAWCRSLRFCRGPSNSATPMDPCPTAPYFLFFVVYSWSQILSIFLLKCIFFRTVLNYTDEYAPNILLSSLAVERKFIGLLSPSKSAQGLSVGHCLRFPLFSAPASASILKRSKPHWTILLNLPMTFALHLVNPPPQISCGYVQNLQRCAYFFLRLFVARGQRFCSRIFKSFYI